MSSRQFSHHSKTTWRRRVSAGVCSDGQRRFIGRSNRIGLIAGLLSEPIAWKLVPGFSIEDKALCAQVFLVLSPTIFITIVCGMYTNFLTAEHHYGVVESLNVGFTCCKRAGSGNHWLVGRNLGIDSGHLGFFADKNGGASDLR